MIQITDKYYADVDKYNWILYNKHIISEEEVLKRKGVCAGDVEYKPLSYHPTLNSLLKKIMSIKEKNIKLVTNLADYIQELEKLQNKFLEEIKNMKEVENYEKIRKSEEN